MHDAHLTLETLARLLAGDLDHETVVQQVIPHFLQHCPTCRTQHARLLAMQKEVGHWDETVVVFEGQEAPERLSELRALPFDEQLHAVVEDEGLQTWGVCSLLLRRSIDTSLEDPGQAIQLAELAVRVSRHLEDSYDPAWVLDLRGRAHACLGNAQRILGELRSAEMAFREAELYLGRSTTGNDRLRAEVWGLEASLRRDQRRFQEALALSDRSLAVYEELGDDDALGAALVKRARTFQEAGELEKAVELLRSVAGKVSPETAPRVFLCSRHNLFSCLIVLARFAEAEAMLPEVRELCRQGNHALDLLRLRWEEAKIAAGLGRAADAEPLLVEVRQDFLDRGMTYDAALVSLDLAILLAEAGRDRELQELAARMVPTFETFEIRREALAALLLFQRACDSERLTVDILRRLADQLSRTRRDRS